jgi:hypothetical protein
MKTTLLILLLTIASNFVRAEAVPKADQILNAAPGVLVSLYWNTAVAITSTGCLYQFYGEQALSEGESVPCFYVSKGAKGQNLCADDSFSAVADRVPGCEARIEVLKYQSQGKRLLVAIAPTTFLNIR